MLNLCVFLAEQLSDSRLRRLWTLDRKVPLAPQVSRPHLLRTTEPKSDAPPPTSRFARAVGVNYVCELRTLLLTLVDSGRIEREWGSLRQKNIFDRNPLQKNMKINFRKVRHAECVCNFIISFSVRSCGLDGHVDVAVEIYMHFPHAYVR